MHLLTLKSATSSSSRLYLQKSLNFVSARWKSEAAAASQKIEQIYNVGDVIHGYKLEKKEFIEELNIEPHLFKHLATGSEHLHIKKEDDTNNVFGVSFRTPPKNSTGVAHILEHTTLCGSENYPVRDPFMRMLTRSLATFMNAFTGSDYTLYPFSTQNSKDFENLLNVYLDAVFFPRLRPVDFRQEGWRLEHEKPDRRETPIVIRGVVYNEMKGVFSSSGNIYGRSLINKLFPDTIYAHESGGDPEHIPSLSYAELQKFHKLHYHPSNAKFYTYGNLPVANHLELIEKKIMSKFSGNQQAQESSFVHTQKLWESSREVKISCPRDVLAANPEKLTTVSVSYMLPSLITDMEEMYMIQMLTSLLMDGPNAPLYKSLVESGIGANYSPGTGLNNYTKQPFISVGLSNISTNDVNKVQEIIENTLIQAKKDGFPRERIDAILHNIELNVKHVSGNFGLRLLTNLESFWNHDGDIMQAMQVNKWVENFKKHLQDDKNYLSNAIDKHFLQNKHKLVLIMEPDEAFEEKRKDKERTLLEERLSKLNETDKQAVFYEGIELMNMQNSKDNANILPCLDANSDIPKKLTHPTILNFESIGSIPVQICEQPTNEVVYFRALSDLTNKVYDENLDDYLPLFCDVATHLGAGDLDRHKFSQQVQLHTGGLSVGIRLNPHLAKLNTFKKEVLLGSYCLKRNVPKMFELWRKVFQDINFDQNKDYVKQLLQASSADLTDGIPHSGNSYAVKKSASALTNLAQLDERLSGLSYIARLKDMASREPIEEILEKLKFIANIVFDPSNMKCSINCEPSSIKSSMDELKLFLLETQSSYKAPDLSSQPSTKFNYAPTKIEDLNFNFATHFVGKSILTVPRLHKDFPKLVILNKLISSKYLLKEVREKGGAYGSGARISNSGIMSFFSYRDPNTTKTLSTFQHTAKWIADSNDYSERDIEESKLGVFQDVDKPVEPGMRGQLYFLLGETDEIRQEYRKRLLEVTKKDIISMSTKYLKKSGSGIFVI